MLTETEEWLAAVRDDLPAEARPLAASLRLLAQSMDGEAAESGRVSGALASNYRQTHRAILETMRAAPGNARPRQLAAPPKSAQETAETRYAPRRRPGLAARVNARGEARGSTGRSSGPAVSRFASLLGVALRVR